MGFAFKLRKAIWGEPAATKGERRLIVKIDAFILSYVCLMYWVNYLDRANLNNAYVSGMREDLNFKGTQLNQINTIFYGGYLLGQIPNNLVMQKISPRLWLPLTCFCWGMLTLGTAFVHHPWQIMVIRFFQGIFEASCFVGVQWILGSWYKPEEIGKRTAIFTSSGLAGTMFSGILQGAIYRNLNGRHGFAGWRWLFVIDALITLPVAFYGWMFFPDTPETTKAKYLSTEERVLAVERLPEVKLERGRLGWSLLRRIFLSWQWWGFVLLWIANSNTEMFSTNGNYQIWLRSTGEYTVEQVNYVPTSQSAFGIVCTLILGWYSDWNTKNRWHVGYILTVTGLISGALMLNPPSQAAKFAAFIINGAQFAGQTVMFAWANDLTRHDDAKRAVVVASMNMLSVAVYMWWSILFYNATQAPNWRSGSIAMLCMSIFLGIVNTGCLWGQKRQEKAEARERGDSFGDAESNPEKFEVQADEENHLGTVQQTSCVSEAGQSSSRRPWITWLDRFIERQDNGTYENGANSVLTSPEESITHPGEHPSMVLTLSGVLKSLVTRWHRVSAWRGGSVRSDLDAMAPATRQSQRLQKSQISTTVTSATKSTTHRVSKAKAIKRTTTTTSKSAVTAATPAESEPKANVPELIVPDAAAWRAWLDVNESTSDGIWLVLCRSGHKDPTSLTRAQSLDEALCSGWIDGQGRSRDAKTYFTRFTPRRKRSLWSAINVGHIQRLRDEGRMRPRGEEEVEKAKADGRWERAYPGPKDMKVPVELLKLLEDEPAAMEIVEGWSSAERYMNLLPVMQTTTDVLKMKRMETLANRLIESTK